MYATHPMNMLSDLQSRTDSSWDGIGAKLSDDTPITINHAEMSSEPTSKSYSDDSSDVFEAKPARSQIKNTGHVEHITSSNSATPKYEAEALIVTNVIQIIKTYGRSRGQKNFLPDSLIGYSSLITEQVREGRPIRFLFSGFPFKSTRVGDLVLGSLPDLGEKLALGHLNSLGSNIAEVYKNGAEIHICLEGLVYNDVFGVPDETVWAYGEELRFMAEKNEFQHLQFIQLWDLLGHEMGNRAKEYVLAHTSCLQRELSYRYASTGLESDQDHEHTRNKGFLDYLTQFHPDETPKEQAKRARHWKARMKAYHSALDANKADYIQLSSHESGFTEDKNTIIISLFPGPKDSEALAPWTSTTAIELDGRYRFIRLDEVRDTEQYDLILDEAGKPSHYRAKAEIWDWESDGLDVTFEHFYPTGTMIRPRFPTAGQTLSIRDLPMRKIRVLSQTFSPIVLRGFRETTNEEYFLSKGHELGDILTWTFGQILKVKDSGEVDKNANNVTSNEAMPMHFDGIFKFVDTVDPVTGAVTKVLTPPRYQYFTCISTAPKGDGYTLFANSRLFFQYLTPPFSLSRFEKATWSMVNDGFWSAKQTNLPLVIRHKESGAPCLRWHEPWTNTKFSKYFVEIENDEAAEEMVNLINKLVYDHRVCLRFSWEQGDLLINDNVSMLHTRTAFTQNCEREMWRIHFD